MIIPFVLALLATLFSSLLFPSLHLITFAPFLALVYMRHSFISSLWLALCAGLIIDLTNSSLTFGLNALAYLGATTLLYKERRNFFKDSGVALMLYTGCISLFLSFIMILFHGISLTPAILLSDLLLMPAVDAVYAFLWFTCPIKLYHYVKRVGWRALLGRSINT